MADDDGLWGDDDDSPLSVPSAGRPGVGIGRVIGTEDSTPLEFWVAVNANEFLQLDDVVALDRILPTPPGPVQIYGMVTQVRARHEGARFDSDVFLIEEGVLPAQISEAAKILATRFEPEVFVPPLPGAPVRRAEGVDRDRALYFDGMEVKLPIGLSRNNEPVYANLEFIDGTRGAHVNISGVSGVATKTSYACFLLYSLFTSGVLHGKEATARSLIFNVKGEDLLFLDQPNTGLDDRQRARYAPLGLDPHPFPSVSFKAPPVRGATSGAPDVHSRVAGVTSFFWTLYQFCKDDLLPFLFADAEDDRSQYPIIIHNVMGQLRKVTQFGNQGAVYVEGELVSHFDRLVELITEKVESDDNWSGRSITQGTRLAFNRRLFAAVRHVEHLVRADIEDPESHRASLDRQVTVIDIHNLNERAQRFVVGAILRRALDDKEGQGNANLLFVVLDELNKYAPREGSSPIKEILLDIAERGRSLGMILIGAQQTASEVERRVVANCALRVVGRLDSAESGREEYGFLPQATRLRATILKPGTMVVSQPELPVPVVLEFPFPAWATRSSEVAPQSVSSGRVPDDPFAALGRPR